MTKNKGFPSFTLFAGILALASLSCGVAEIPNTFAADTPTQTSAFTPSPTATSTQSPANTPSLTSTPSPTGRHVEELASNNFRFTDYDFGYEIICPSDWIVVPMQSEEQEAASARLRALDPSSFGALELAMRGLPGILAVKPTGDNNTDLDILAIGIGYEGEVFAATSLQDAIDHQEIPKGAKLLFKDIVTNESGTEMGRVEWDDGETHTITSVFKTDKGLVILSITAPTAKFESVSQELEDLIGTVKVFK